MSGPIHWEFLPRGVALTGEMYRKQLSTVNARIQALISQGRRENGRVFFLHDGASPHRAGLTRKHITNTLGWHLLPHPSYSCDIAPSDYHVFRALKQFLRNQHFRNDAEVENAVKMFFDTKKDTAFFEIGIRMLPHKWQAVIDANGEYPTT